MDQIDFTNSTVFYSLVYELFYHILFFFLFILFIIYICWLKSVALMITVVCCIEVYKLSLQVIGLVIKR